MSGQNTNITKNIGSLQGLTISNIGNVTTTTSVVENNNISNSTAQMYGDIVLKVSDDLYTSIQEDSSGGIISTDSIEQQQKYRKRITYFRIQRYIVIQKQEKEGTYIEFGPNGTVVAPTSDVSYYDSVGISLYATNVVDNRKSHRALSIYTTYDSDNLKSKGVVDISGHLTVSATTTFNNNTITDVSSITANAFFDSEGRDLTTVMGVTGSRGVTGAQGATGAQGFQGVTGAQGARALKEVQEHKALLGLKVLLV